ncbi:dynein intermediate chain 4, axonemal isoform X1 [Drosophila subpulchrella]|uniref:dynein intermediate chain 4, axonemal isoform X1 n=1 Tax=Drosophila subpulchrella TaxID=1486046 RepID=UPI0018A144A1|nr:dynein intermediate chain 4, axonemal isoform X1 [Drosophila subpulchrella]
MSMSVRNTTISQDMGSIYKQSSTLDGDLKKKSVQVTQVSGEDTKVKKKETVHYYHAETQADLQYRAQIKIVEDVDGEEVDMTPKPIPNDTYVEQFMKYNLNVMHQMTNFTTMLSKSMTRSRTRSSVRAGIGGNKQSIDDLMNGIIYETINWDPYKTVESLGQAYVPKPYTKSFLKITLRKSEIFELHSQPQTTVAKGSPEGDETERDNRNYEYLTVGKGKIRRRSDNDAQTDTLLFTTRAVNTIMITKATVSSYVSNFEMYDTLNNITKEFAMSTMGSVKDLAAALGQTEDGESFEDDETVAEKDKVTSQIDRLYRNPEFRNAVMYMGRTLSSNTNEAGLRRFRNFDRVDRWNAEAEYVYSMNLLFRLVPEPSHDERKAVSDIDFCRSNGDILAVAYGLYSFSSQHVPTSGSVFLWSIKNPGEPERAYYYDVPVTAICFSPFLPSLLAIGLYDGSVEVREVCSLQDMPIAVSQRVTSPSSSPVVAIRWIKQVSDDVDEADIDPFLSLSQDGSVTRFRIIKSPFLLGFTQMTLERVEGHPEGIFVPHSSRIPCESNRHPQGLSITTHPLHKDIYYVLTDEGCIHKCSINYQHQYLEVLRCHDGGVTVMEFSPWSPKLFLTCGNDWFVRIWIDGITRPLLELQDEMTPVHWAKWSPTHSTIIVSVNRETANIWDFRRNLLRPMSKHKMDSSFNTVARFSHCGRTLVIGNERGNTLFNALNDMPFSPHFQYDELEKAIFKAIGSNHELFMELKSIGFFGYPNKKAVF